VDALFEDQEDLPSHVRVEAHGQILSGPVEAKVDVPRVERVPREAPLSLQQIAQRIAFGIDRPDDIAHRVDQLPRDLGDPFAKRGDTTVSFDTLQRHLAEHSHLRERRADIVVQVHCEPRANAFDLARPPPKFSGSGATSLHDDRPFVRPRLFPRRILSTAAKRFLVGSSEGETHGLETTGSKGVPEKRRRVGRRFYLGSRSARERPINSVAADDQGRQRSDRLR
jgi:hypothetical protein